MAVGIARVRLSRAQGILAIPGQNIPALLGVVQKV
jgi:hypothetical protein